MDYQIKDISRLKEGADEFIRLSLSKQLKSKTYTLFKTKEKYYASPDVQTKILRELYNYINSEIHKQKVAIVIGICNDKIELLNYNTKNRLKRLRRKSLKFKAPYWFKLTIQTATPFMKIVLV